MWVCGGGGGGNGERCGFFEKDLLTIPFFMVKKICYSKRFLRCQNVSKGFFWSPHLVCISISFNPPPAIESTMMLEVTWSNPLLHAEIHFMHFLTGRHPIFARRLPEMGFQRFYPEWFKLLEGSFWFWVQICSPMRYAHGLELWWLCLVMAVHIFEDGYFSTMFSFLCDHPVFFLGSFAMTGLPSILPPSINNDTLMTFPCP